jgi:hypothetical protein
MMADCWCGGDMKGYNKHIQRVHKTPTCRESRAANAKYHREYTARRRAHISEYNRNHVTGWIVGSEIDLSDDEL